MKEPLLAGDALPWFDGAILNGSRNFSISVIAGLPIVMLVLGSGAAPQGAAALATLAAHRDLFDDEKARFFGISIDPADISEQRIARQLPGVRWFMDHGSAISRQLGAVTEDAAGLQYQPHWLLLDSTLRVVSRKPIREGAAIMAGLRELLAAGDEAPAAPVLIVPRIFEPDLCERLIARYEARGGVSSGFMREQGGKTVEVADGAHKRRTDHMIDDQALIDELRSRLGRFLLPQIQRAFQFRVTRVERWVVACYDSEDGGHFSAHRDNTTKGTAHRRFACTINLNAGDYDGGDLVFPEFGSRPYRAPTGGAVIFSCGLLHAAKPVTRGRRYAFLPFFYDEAGAKIREQNTGFVTGNLATYRAGP